MTQRSAIIGAGPAGLAAAHEWVNRFEVKPIVLEGDTQVGGLSRTVEKKGYRFDIGGHRFFTKNREVEALWQSVLPEQFLRRPRMSRIYYRGKLFHYPLKPLNALSGLGFFKSCHVGMSFLGKKIFPRKPEESFEDWVSNRFGSQLYEIFFKTYTEKVWGIPCTELSADWAAQRIRNLDLLRAVVDALGLGQKRSVASLIDEFDYPAHGPGQMYEQMARDLGQAGAELRLQSEVLRVRHQDRRVCSLEIQGAGSRSTLDVDRLISTMPISDLVLRLSPAAPEGVLEAARSLRYRSILTVNLVVQTPEFMPDTWVYLHDPEIQAGRLQMYKNWSPHMVPDPATSSLGFEYFTFEGDSLWSSPDQELVRMATADLGRIKHRGRTPEVLDGFVVRYAKAYPMYEGNYKEKLDRIRDYLAQFQNLACAGRYGQFRYNNMDHSILTGMLAARRLLGGEVDPWGVNEEAEYHEEKQLEEPARSKQPAFAGEP